MADLQKAYETQLENIQKRSGKRLSELSDILKSSGLTKHGEMRDYLKRELGMGHGDANTFVHYFRDQTEAATRPSENNSSDVLANIYVGPKAELLPIHERLIEAINQFGDYETAPKKSYVSLRRKKQFAMIGPATKTRVDLGLNMKGVPATDRLVEMKPGGMCNYKVKLETADEVDAEVIAWIRLAYDRAG